MDWQPAQSLPHLLPKDFWDHEREWLLISKLASQ